MAAEIPRFDMTDAFRVICERRVALEWRPHEIADQLGTLRGSRHPLGGLGNTVRVHLVLARLRRRSR